jgi:ribonuclease P protein component
MRLRAKGEFLKIRNDGRRLAKGCLIANWLLQPGVGRCCLGVITSRRLGNAVIRARARRLMREAFRMHQHDFRASLDLVLIARSSIVGKMLTDVERDLLSLLRLANLLKKID